MNSSRYRNRSSLYSNATLAALALSMSLATPAAAQQGQLALPEAQAVAVPAVPIETAPGDAAKSIALPADANLSGADEKVREMSAAAARSLEELIGSSVTPRTEAEVGQMAERQRRIQMLEFKLEEAKLAKQLWVEINGEQEGSSDEIERLHAEKASLEAELVKLQSARMNPPPADPDPVVAEITGAGGSMRAKILVPYMGEVVATNGSTLPNGMKVVGMSKDGVTVSTDAGNRKVLAFGDSVPKNRPVSMAPGAAVIGAAPSAANALQQIGQ